MSGEALYFWLVPSSVLVGLLGIAGQLLPGLPLLERLSRCLAWGYSVAVAVAWVLRIRQADHLPLFGTYESALSLALATLLAAIVWEAAGRGRVAITPLAALAAGVLLGHGRSYDPTPYALTISERSWVVDVHALVAWAAFGILAVNSILALRLLLARGRGAPQVPHWLVLSLQIGFVLHSAMLASGSFYKFLLFGEAWSFDPIETLGFVAWIAYGTLLHMHLFAGWEGRRLARWCLSLFVLLVVSYRGIVYFPAWSTYHIFDMDLRMHLTGGEEIPPGGNT